MLLRAFGRITCKHLHRMSVQSSCLQTSKARSDSLLSSVLQATSKNFLFQAPSTCQKCSSLCHDKTLPLSYATKSSSHSKCQPQKLKSIKKCAAVLLKSSSEAARQAAQLCSQTQRQVQSTRTLSTELTQQHVIMKSLRGLLVCRGPFSFRLHFSGSV